MGHREKTFTEDTVFEMSFGARISTGRDWRQRSQAEGKPSISRGTGAKTEDIFRKLSRAERSHN